MRILLAILLLFINPVKDLNKVAETNALKKEAKEAFEAGNFDKAVESYEKLTQDFGVTDDNILSNLANAYYKQGNLEQAISHYQNLAQSENGSIRSDANNQLGIIAHQQQKAQEAINYFKEALKADPSNEAARFNYSKLKKEQEENQDNQESQDDQNQDNQDNQNKDQENQDQNQQDQQNQDQQDQSGEADQQQEEDQSQQEQQDQGDEQQENQKSTAEKLEEMNMTEEKAKMILEAMKNNEIQYIQQNKKKPQSRVDDGRPDW